MGENIHETMKRRMTEKKEETFLEFMIRKEKEKGIRPEMLPKPLPTYEREDSRIPERIRVSFSDGTTAIYDLHTDQPAPIIEENIRIIRKWKQGYVNQPARRRRNRT